MFSFEFFIAFIFIGGALRIFLGPTASIIVVILISVGWGFVFGPWAVATFVELIIGWAGGQAAANIKLKNETGEGTKVASSRRQDVSLEGNVNINTDDESEDDDIGSELSNQVREFFNRNESYSGYWDLVIENAFEDEHESLEESSFERIISLRERQGRIAACCMALKEIMELEDPSGETLEQSGEDELYFFNLLSERTEKHIVDFKDMDGDEKENFILKGTRFIKGN
ncbi:MAG: hypothetical protein ABJ000_10960 [Saccharospirillum sp.]|uniref:hypothetical protein n=1 Tax=Saccharospirillum sp. TaxID=2033801 RepID=UPI0032984053